MPFSKIRTILSMISTARGVWFQGAALAGMIAAAGGFSWLALGSGPAATPALPPQPQLAEVSDQVNLTVAELRQRIRATALPDPVAGRAPLRSLKAPETYPAARRLLRSEIYANPSERVEFYCGCRYDENGRVDPRSCGLQARSNQRRADRIEWEHIVPASWFGRDLQCWQTGDPVCVNGKGPYKGRKCCRKADPRFAAMEADMHNLVPSVGEVNGDRSARRYSEVMGEPREYGACDFEIDFDRDVAEPAASRIGDIARAEMYLSWRWRLPISRQRLELLQSWDRLDPPVAWEFERNRRIQHLTGVSNPFITKWRRQ